ncbi:MAG: queuosine salvage family protein [Solirubrobacteraceae bacterium]
MYDATINDLRAACALVAERARHVGINVEAIPSYASALEVPPLVANTLTTTEAIEDAAARVLTLDAINFGSGWFPTLKKRPGLSGYRTIAKGLGERFEANGPWPASELEQLEVEALAQVLAQAHDHPLIPLFVASLRDLGGHVQSDFGGRFAVIPEAAHGSALALVSELRAWDSFKDESTYDELTLPFLKRAQIAAADLHRAGAAQYEDLHELTIFADNLVPHVLTLDGILALSPDLQRKIANEELLTHDSKEEVELRACAVHAAELILAHKPGTTAAALDGALWERGGGAFYKASPRPRCRTTAY